MLRRHFAVESPLVFGSSLYHVENGKPQPRRDREVGRAFFDQLNNLNIPARGDREHRIGHHDQCDGLIAEEVRNVTRGEAAPQETKSSGNQLRPLCVGDLASRNNGKDGRGDNRHKRFHGISLLDWYRSAQ